MNAAVALLLFAAPAIASAVGTGLVLRVLRRNAVLDHPNRRSGHQVPTPRGGGLAVTGVVVTAWAAVAIAFDDRGAGALAAPVVVGALALAAVSWVDDLNHVAPGWRLMAQGIAVAGILWATPDEALYFGGMLPAGLDVIAAGLLWLWFVNLFNFMDGMDGLSGLEACVVGLGVAMVAWIAGPNAPLEAWGLALAGAACGFLWWNRPPARIFLGDVGSVPLGFLLGWLLLRLAAEGQMVAALILPLYYIADATWTMVRRAVAGKVLWQAHRGHFYQRAVDRGVRVGTVLVAVLAIDLALGGLAAAAAWGWPGAALAVAGGAVLLLLHLLASGLGSRGGGARP